MNVIHTRNDKSVSQTEISRGVKYPGGSPMDISSSPSTTHLKQTPSLNLTFVSDIIVSNLVAAVLSLNFLSLRRSSVSFLGVQPL